MDELSCCKGKKALLLLSGGIDSPVAGSLVKRAGAELFALHFSSMPFVGPEVEEKCRVLSSALGVSGFFSEDIGKDLESIATNCKYSLYFVLQKRLFLRRAELLAKRIGAGFLVTGDSIGQVSSQTLQNLSVIDSAVKIPVARPLVSFDKEETISIARKIGTYDISKGPEACCALGPRHPATYCTIEEILFEEKKLGLSDGKD